MIIEYFADGLPLTDYLQIEQNLVRTVKEPTLFTWIVKPTVIYGRHQTAEVEVNEAFCSEHDIKVVQRMSGGGCVYADEGNVMVSFISPSTHNQEVFNEFLHLLSSAFRSLGYNAVTTQHNDVMVADRKVSGTACYTTPTGTVVHASILYDVNLDWLEKAITPTPQKLAKHAVQSVRQRVVNLKTIRDVGDTSAFRKQLEHTLLNI